MRALGQPESAYGYFWVNPVSASCSLRIDWEIGMSMTGIKVQRS
jgi:hypothetical protein